jgi:hypothetical protein
MVGPLDDGCIRRGRNRLPMRQLEDRSESAADLDFLFEWTGL